MLKEPSHLDGSFEYKKNRLIKTVLLSTTVYDLVHLNNDTEDKAQKRRYNAITSHRCLYIVLLDTHSYLEI